MQAARAIEHRIRGLQGELVGFLARRTRDDPEEVAQEVWLRVTKAAPDCPTDADFRAYTFAVARRVLVDRHRRRAARIQLVPLEGGVERAGGHDPHDEVRAGDVLAVVEAALADMKPELSEVFRWRTTSDLAFKDIAQRQGCSVNTALGRMHQAVKKLRAALHAADLLPPGGSP